MKRLAAFVSIVVLAVAGLAPAGLLGASASTRFDDVPQSHNFYRDIEWLAATGITHGCNPPDNNLFCPDDSVTRGEMAAFLVRALDLTSGGPDFDDTDHHLFEEEIARLAAAGITLGCNPPANNLFCPDEPVIRGEMAAFLTRGLDLPRAPDQGFTDSEGVFFDNINSLAAAGITLGCNPPVNSRFCPNESVTRGEMAAFLHRGLEDTVPTTTTSSTTSTTSPTTTSSTTTTTQPGDFEPFTITGTGNDVPAFRIPGDVPAVLDVTHEGDGHFAVVTLDDQHDYIELLVNEIGDYEGRVGANIGWFDADERVHHLEIDADGNWEITARPMSAARRFGGSPVSLPGDNVLVYTSGSNTITSTHDGEGHFAIVGHLSTGEYNELIVNEIGDYSGTDTIDGQNTRILEIVADGTWTVRAP